MRYALRRCAPPLRYLPAANRRSRGQGKYMTEDFRRTTEAGRKAGGRTQSNRSSFLGQAAYFLLLLWALTVAGCASSVDGYSPLSPYRSYRFALEVSDGDCLLRATVSRDHSKVDLSIFESVSRSKKENVLHLVWRGSVGLGRDLAAALMAIEESSVRARPTDLLVIHGRFYELSVSSSSGSTNRFEFYEGEGSEIELRTRSFLGSLEKEIGERGKMAADTFSTAPAEAGCESIRLGSLSRQAPSAVQSHGVGDGEEGFAEGVAAGPPHPRQRRGRDPGAQSLPGTLGYLE